MWFECSKNAFKWWQSYLVTISKLTFPKSSAPMLKNKKVYKAGAHKEIAMLALLELFLRNKPCFSRGM